MKVCSLYGVGFYYVPGTDICLKLGMYVRAEYGVGNYGASMTNLDATGADGQRTRITGPDYQQRTKAVAWIDSRQQTAYGTLRAYMAWGNSNDFTGGASFYFNRGFVQLAGFTWGLATSYYDFYSSPATAYSTPWSGDTGDPGWKVAAYTAQLGNGVSASLSLEQPRNSSIANVSVSNSFIVGALPTVDQRKVVMPDFVANVRVDQAWGSAQLMGALTNNGGGYYGTTLAGSQNNGRPSDKLGFAIGAGLKVNFPMIGPGDYFQAQVNYTEGASRYSAFTPAGSASPGIFEGGNQLGIGFFSDAVYCGNVAGGAAGCPAGTTSSSLQLTTVWNVNASYEHFWTPSLRTSLVGAYHDISYNDTASAQLCTTGGSTAAGGLSGLSSCAVNSGAGAFDWSYYSLSSRTQWNITKDFYVGLEGYYGHLNTMSKGATGTYTQAAAGAQPTGVRTLADQDVFVYRMRVHRDIVP